MDSSRHYMDTSQHAVRWDKGVMEPAAAFRVSQDSDAPIRVLNDAFRSASSQKLKLVSLLDDEGGATPASQRFVSSNPVGDKPRAGRRHIGTYQGSAMASLSSMLAEGAFADDSDDGCVEGDRQHAPQPPSRPAAPGHQGSGSLRTSKSGAADSSQFITSLLGPPDPSLYSPVGPDGETGQGPAQGSGMRTSFLGSTDYAALDESRFQEDTGPVTLSKLLDKFAAEEDAGPIIRSKNYVKQASVSQGHRSSNNPRNASSLAHLEDSYGGRSKPGNSRGVSMAGDVDFAGEGAEEAAGNGSFGHRLSGGLSMGSLTDPFQAASEAMLNTAVSRPPRPARPSSIPPPYLPDQLPGGGGSRGSSPIPGRPRPRPLDQGLVSSTSDIQSLQDAGSKPSVVFSSVSSLPPLAGCHAQGTPPRPRQPPRAAGGLAPSPPPQPSPPQGERVLSRHASPARGALGSRDPSPARPVPRVAGSRDASPSGPRPLAATEIVAAAVAEIAAASREQLHQQHGGGGSAGGASSGSPGGPREGRPGAAPRPPKPHGQAGTGVAPGMQRAAPPAAWDVALRDASPSRMPVGQRAPASEDSFQQQQGEAPPPRPRASGPMLRSRDSSPLRASLTSAGNAMDPDSMAEIMWRLPMRMGVATQSPARVSGGGGRTSRDASPDARGLRTLTEEPVLATASAAGPARPPKPLMKSPNWGRGGDPRTGRAPSAGEEDSGLGNTLPSLVQAHVFMEGGQFDIVQTNRR